MPIHSRKGERSGREERPESHCIRFGCSWALAQKKDGAELALQEPIPAAQRRKIIRILLRVAAVPVRFLCHSLRTAHRIQKTRKLFFAALSLDHFRVRSRRYLNLLHRALAAAPSSFPALHLYFSSTIAFTASIKSTTSERPTRETGVPSTTARQLVPS